MEIAKDIDYTPHYLQVKCLLRDVYELLSERRFSEAEELSVKLLAETKLLLNAVKAQK